MTDSNKDMVQNKIILYQADNSNVSVDVYFHNETFWLTQKAMSDLFDVDRTSISKHLKNIFETDELDETVVCEEIAHTTQHGAIADKQQMTKSKCSHLDAIIAVGYRVNSKSATQFRRWATNTLREYIIKGFVLNDDMLKNGRAFGKDYFDELLERIKEIRASERRFYQKITDIYAQCSYDYDPQSDITKNFFKEVQNKLLFAATGSTAPEIIAGRADSNKPHMGLTTWKNAPDGKVSKTDVIVSKNYLNQDELSGLNDIVNMYLDYAENQAKRQKLMAMDDWAVRLDSFLQFNEYDLLKNKGKIKRTLAESLATAEFEKFRVVQDQNYISDFDKSISKYIDKKK